MLNELCLKQIKEVKLTEKGWVDFRLTSSTPWLGRCWIAFPSTPRLTIWWRDSHGTWSSKWGKNLHWSTWCFGIWKRNDSFIVAEWQLPGFPRVGNNGESNVDHQPDFIWAVSGVIAPCYSFSFHLAHFFPLSTLHFVRWNSPFFFWYNISLCFVFKFAVTDTSWIVSGH